MRRLLAERGQVSVAEFMEWCLTGRAEAYYRRAEAIGRAGDFITAPEVSQIFGELVGLWAGATWLSMGRPPVFSLIELGPGRGTLMADALRALKVVPGVLEAARPHLVERSERLRQAQRERLGQAQRERLGWAAPVWHESLESVPEGPAILIANEFFDALPVAQFVRARPRWHERVVALGADGEPCFSVGEPAGLPRFTSPPEEAGDGAILEARPSAWPVVAEMGRRAALAPLAALIIDYGYARDASGDTLQAVSAHGYADPLATPGEADLSAHVGFAELARMASAAGLTAWGPMPQGEFLLALGLEARLGRLVGAARPDQRTALVTGARRLADPYQMGVLFKAMALAGPGLAAPPPFAEGHPPTAEER